MEKESQGSTVYIVVGAGNLRIGLGLYSGCRLVQNRLETLISGEVILKICVQNYFLKKSFTRSMLLKTLNSRC